MWRRWRPISWLLWVSACSSPQALPPAYLRFQPARLILENDTLVVEAPIDAWVYPAGRFLAVAEPGGRLPIVPAQTTPILIAGGVRENGLAVSRKVYPFWQFDTLSEPLAPEGEFVYTPLYRYFPDTMLRYFLRESFESPQLSLTLVNAGQPDAAPLRRTIESPRRGFWAGEVVLGPYADFRAESTLPFEFPQSEVWAELSLRGDRNLGVGLTIENRATGALIDRRIYLVLRPADTAWTTFFVNLTPWMAGQGTLFRYRLYLTSAGDTVGTHKIYLDDVRILSFQKI